MLWHPLLHQHLIPYLSTYTTFSSRPTGHLRIHKVVALPGPRSSHQHPQLTSIPSKYPEPTPAPTKLPQHMSVLGKISSTGVDPGLIVPSRRLIFCSSAVIGPTLSDPQPNIFNRRRGSKDLHQVASTSLAKHQDYSRLSPTDTAVPQNYLQPTPQFNKLLSTDARPFEPATVTPQKPY